MRILRNSKSVLVMGSFLVVLVGLWLAPSWGMASEEMSIGVGVVQGDPGDALGGDAVERLDLHFWDPRDGLDGPITRLLGDPGDGTDLPGDPDDALDYFKIYCDPGDLVLGYVESPLFGYFWLP